MCQIYGFKEFYFAFQRLHSDQDTVRNSKLKYITKTPGKDYRSKKGHEQYLQDTANLV